MMEIELNRKHGLEKTNHQLKIKLQAKWELDKPLDKELEARIRDMVPQEMLRLKTSPDLRLVTKQVEHHHKDMVLNLIQEHNSNSSNRMFKCLTQKHS